MIFEDNKTISDGEKAEMLLEIVVEIGAKFIGVFPEMFDCNLIDGKQNVIILWLKERRVAYEIADAGIPRFGNIVLRIMGVRFLFSSIIHRLLYYLPSNNILSMTSQASH